jgi:hypothetical protein
VKAAPDVYTDYVTVTKRGEKSLLVECYNGIYGMMVAGLLYYCKFLSSLDKKGFTVNPYDPCVWNKDINEKQLTICFHIDDCKISHVDPKVNDKTIAWLRKEYESVFMDGTGKMKVARGKVHKYLGMTLDFTTPKLVKITMLEYVDEIIESWDKACNELKDGYNTVPVFRRIATAAPDNLFRVDEDAVKLEQKVAKIFAMLLEKKSRSSSSKRTKHIKIRYYYVADRVAKGDVNVVWCPTDQMIADFLTKPLQGKAFVEFWDKLMGVV